MTEQVSDGHGELLLKQLNMLRTRARFLPARHPSVQSAIAETLQLLQELLRRPDALTLVMRGGEAFLNGKRLPKESLRFAGLIQRFNDLQIHAIQFLSGIQEQELTRFVDACFVRDESSFDLDKARTFLESGPFPNIRLNQEDLAHEAGAPEETPEDTVLAVARDSYEQAVRATIGAYYDSNQGGKINVDLTVRTVSMLQEGITDHPDTYFALSQLREFSEYTYYHSVNVAIISMLLGSGIGLDREAVGRLGVAAMLHDLGKICVPEDVLDKPGRLDDKERAIMETHPLDSVRILLDQNDIFPAGLAVAAQHHAKFDLTGYPNFKNLGYLHLFSHICTIADVYDALRSARSYKPAMLPDKSMEILLESMGKTFHPVLLKAFFRMVGFYPVGSAVELNTGEFAVVTATNHRAPLSPQVKIITDDEDGTEVRSVDLSETTQFGDQPRAVIRAVEPADHGIRVADHL